MEDKPTYISWCDHNSLPTLNPHTVLDYFCKPTNPFYDRTCNNEHLRMQGFGLVSEQLKSMEGFEYMLLHAQPPELYVIRKQHRSSPTQETPLVDYYIIRGVVFQSPDLASVLNVRLLNAVHAVRRALDEASSKGRFAMSKGGISSWVFDGTQNETKATAKTPTLKNRQQDPDRAPTAFQKIHTDMAIAELTKRFPQVSNNQSSGSGAQQVPVDKSSTSATAQAPATQTNDASKRSKLT